MAIESDGRREVASRNTKWANTIARILSKYLTPNQISILSVVFSAIGGGIMLLAVYTSSVSLYLAFIVYIVCIQMRLLCNLFDGMVAIEGNKKSKNGDFYNDMPDRFSDVLLIIPVGYVVGGIGIELAWLAALLAVLTAYFRWIGAYVTHNHYFNGPMAKQHRMALLTLATVIALCTIHIDYYKQVFLIALIVMNVGLIVTLIKRLYLMSRLRNYKK